ncbi:hypothetical protein QPK13_02910 [Photorhabdus tasmaniensis]|uniref:Uncharacterized protein n=1 Tax=Photorhabdus tasmaniensis TaxID=1004159 RepID=A0ABX0GD15_9GAMM|nr:hypothetical protein [Photorhabdus tasmaniensis]NHB86201.1 hypothetical protein [Photorhabdus tasmaniensis]
MNLYSIAFGFISGVIITIIAAIINHKIKIKSETENKIRNSEYKIMLKLGELYQEYFWLATNELHKKKTDDSIIVNIYNIATDIAKELHENESSEFTEDLLRIIYDESYDTYNNRWKDMANLSDRMAKKLVPQHNAIIKRINDENITLMAQPSFISKAPASSRFRFRI